MIASGQECMYDLEKFPKRHSYLYFNIHAHLKLTQTPGQRSFFSQAGKLQTHYSNMASKNGTLQMYWTGATRQTKIRKTFDTKFFGVDDVHQSLPALNSIPRLV